GAVAVEISGRVFAVDAGRAALFGNRRDSGRQRGDGPLARVQGPARSRAIPDALFAVPWRMKCRETQYWLFSFRPNASWPADVVGHLQQCAECQKLQAKLKQIEQGVATLTSVPGNPSAKERLLDRIEQTPQQPGGHETIVRRPSAWLKTAA